MTIIKHNVYMVSLDVGEMIYTVPCDCESAAQATQIAHVEARKRGHAKSSLLSINRIDEFCVLTEN